MPVNIRLGAPTISITEVITTFIKGNITETKFIKGNITETKF